MPPGFVELGGPGEPRGLRPLRPERYKADYWAIFELPEDVEPKAVAMAQARIDSFATRWRDSYPAAVRCLLDDRDSLTVYLRFPREHWTHLRTTNSYGLTGQGGATRRGGVRSAGREGSGFILSLGTPVGGGDDGGGGGEADRRVASA